MVMLELFFSSSETVHNEFIPEGATVNNHCYKEILHLLCKSICHKYPELLCKKNWLLLSDNTLHITLSVQELGK
jgi:hypothetical protein